MREIKFRVWDGGAMFYPSYNLQSSNCSPTGDACVVQGLDNCGHISSDVEILQFTGLQDKNNKDIYEGDILFRESAGYKYIVFWDTPEGSWKLEDFDGDKSIYLGDFSQKNLEIVGNIFEIKNES